MYKYLMTSDLCVIRDNTIFIRSQKYRHILILYHVNLYNTRTQSSMDAPTWQGTLPLMTIRIIYTI